MDRGREFAGPPSSTTAKKASDAPAVRGEIRSKQEPIYDAGSGPIPPDTSSVVSPELDVLSADLLSTDVLSAGDPSERAPGVSGGQLAQGVDQQLRAQLEQTQQNLLQMLYLLSQVEGQMQQMGLVYRGIGLPVHLTGADRFEC